MKKSSTFKRVLSLLFAILISTTGAEAADRYTFRYGWGGSTSEGSTAEGKFYTPMGVAIAPSGNVYVADTSNKRIQEFTSDGIFITKWGKNGGDGSWGSGDGEFRNPRAVEVGPAGKVYVGDSENYRVQIFASNGEFISKWNSIWAEHMAIDPLGNVYIGLQNMSGKIIKYSSSGSIITEWTTGSSPAGLAIDTSGYIYVACSSDNLIQKYTLDGVLVNSWGSYGSANGQFHGPRGIALGLNGNVFVVDSGNNRIQVFDSNGTFITNWGTYGSGDGKFNMPYDIAVNSEGKVYVADAYNNRIQVFSPVISGDITNDGTVDLQDAIAGLQVVAGISSPVSVLGDVNEDNRICIEEVIYALQCVARLRNNHTP